jgi:hypothetical protein
MVKFWCYGLGRSSVRINASGKTPYLDDLTITRQRERERERERKRERHMKKLQRHNIRKKAKGQK